MWQPAAAGLAVALAMGIHLHMEKPLLVREHEIASSPTGADFVRPARAASGNHNVNV